MSKRRTTLRHVESCVQQCWKGDEEAFFASSIASWPRASRRYTCTCSDKEESEEKHHGDFEDTKQEIEYMERARKDKKGLLQAYTKIRDGFSNTDPYLSPQERNWMKVRFYTLDAVQRCVAHCLNGNIEAFLTLPDWPEVGRNYRCRCHLAKPQLNATFDPSDNQSIEECHETVRIAPFVFSRGHEMERNQNTTPTKRPAIAATTTLETRYGSTHSVVKEENPKEATTEAINKKQKLNERHTDVCSLEILL